MFPLQHEMQSHASFPCCDVYHSHIIVLFMFISLWEWMRKAKVRLCLQLDDQELWVQIKTIWIKFYTWIENYYSVALVTHCYRIAFCECNLLRCIKHIILWFRHMILLWAGDLPWLDINLLCMSQALRNTKPHWLIRAIIFPSSFCKRLRFFFQQQHI